MLFWKNGHMFFTYFGIGRQSIEVSNVLLLPLNGVNTGPELINTNSPKYLVHFFIGNDVICE